MSVMVFAVVPGAWVDSLPISKMFFSNERSLLAVRETGFSEGIYLPFASISSSKSWRSFRNSATNTDSTLRRIGA